MYGLYIMFEFEKKYDCFTATLCQYLHNKECMPFYCYVQLCPSCIHFSHLDTSWGETEWLDLFDINGSWV